MKEISLHILDLVQNSIRAKASFIEIKVDESEKNNLLKISISDNGKGMTQEFLQKSDDPFFTSRKTRKVGLGIPLFKQLAEHCNGNFSISSFEGKGTTLNSSMELNHIDRQPMGDIPGVLVILISANRKTDFVYTHKTDYGEYVLNTAELKNILGNEGVYESELLKYLKEMIQENLIDIQSTC